MKRITPSLLSLFLALLLSIAPAYAAPSTQPATRPSTVAATQSVNSTKVRKLTRRSIELMEADKLDEGEEQSTEAIEDKPTQSLRAKKKTTPAVKV